MEIPDHDPKYDAMSLAEAAAIKDDPSRLIAAQGAAAELKAEALAKAEGLTGIARGLYDHSTSVAARDKRTKEQSQQ